MESHSALMPRLQAIGRSPHCGAIAIVLFTWVVMIGSAPGLSIVWDEGVTLYRMVRIRAWFSAMRDPKGFASSWDRNEAWSTRTRCLVLHDAQRTPRGAEIDTVAKLLQPRNLRWFWPFAREEPHGHPPFYALVGLVGDLIAPNWTELARARLGTMLVFGLTAGLIYGNLIRRYGAAAGLVGAAAWVFQPHMWGLGHYATYDSLLTSLWVMSVLAFAKFVEVYESGNGARSRWAWVVVFGVVCGWALDTKFTGWFLPIPFMVWAIVRRDRRVVFALVAGLLVAVLTAYVFNPSWWFEPIAGIERFLHSNLTRGSTMPLRVQFLGRFYVTPIEGLPWYNTLVWVVFATPIGFLLLAIVGTCGVVRGTRTAPLASLTVYNLIFVLILRALPRTPGHDGIRLFLPAFGMLSVAAGLGAAEIVRRLGGRGRAFCVAAVVEGIVSVAVMMPVPLSYYSPVVGGLRGATALGMEPTYYWDAFTVDALDWVNHNTAPHGKVRFSNSYPLSLDYLRETGQLRPGINWEDPGMYQWYVVQNRPGLSLPIDRGLIKSATPAFVVTKMGVPLVWIFRFSDVAKWAVEHSDPMVGPEERQGDGSKAGTRDGGIGKHQ